MTAVVVLLLASLALGVVALLTTLKWLLALCLACWGAAAVVGLLSRRQR